MIAMGDGEVYRHFCKRCGSPRTRVLSFAVTDVLFHMSLTLECVDCESRIDVEACQTEGDLFIVSFEERGGSE